MAPELSVIVPTHNRRELLKTCLESLRRQTCSPERFEVVVVVDGSTDGTVEMLGALSAPFRLLVLDRPQAGVSAARNAGVAQARGRVLLFIDDDEEADPGLVVAHLEAHAERGIACFGVIERRVPPGADRFARTQAEDGRRENVRLAAMGMTYADACAGNCSVTREVFDEVGGYAEDLPRENDFEFAYRLTRGGVQLRFLPQAIVSEYRTRPWRQIVADRHLRGRLAVELHRRHPAIVERMEMGGSEGLSRGWITLRAVALRLGIPPVWLAWIGLVLPRPQWAQRWFRFASNLAYWSGVKAASDSQTWRSIRRGVLILRYHAFGERGESPSRYVVPERRFARQLALLRRGPFNVISLDQYLAYRREHRFPPPRSVVLTIDDGYVDTDTVARPLLERHGLSATVFMITSVEAQGGQDDTTLGRRELLGVDRAAKMAGPAIGLGVHTRSHQELTTLDAEEVRRQVIGSKQDLEDAVNAPALHFSYPYGETSEEIRAIVREAGFATACGVKPGHNRLATDLYDLRRVEVRGTYSLFRFWLTLLLGDTSGLSRRR